MSIKTISLIIIVIIFSILQLILTSPDVGQNVKGIDPRDIVNINGSRFYISPRKVHFYNQNGIQMCNGDNMKLISLNTAEKEKMIFDYLLATEPNSYDADFWTSGMRHQRQWIWTGNGQLFNYTNWFTPGNEPDYSSVGVDPCVWFNPFFGWYDERCVDIVVRIICEVQ